jgi:hypothetical protein
MLVRTSLCALAIAAALAPQAFAQSRASLYDPAPPGSIPRPSVEIGRGRVIWQNYDQRKRIEAMMPGVEKAVVSQVADPASAELRGLRTGRYQTAMVVCGFVETAGANGGKDKQRFIARPTVATLESPDNADAFQAGWKSTGCGF